MAELFSILMVTDAVEKAYVRDAITAQEYTPACTKLIAQFKTARDLCNIPDLESFMQEFKLSCPAATKRLIEIGVPATVEHAVAETGSSRQQIKVVADITTSFITLMDSIKLNMIAMDQLHPLLSDLIQLLNKVPNLPSEFDEHKSRLKNCMSLNAATFDAASNPILIPGEKVFNRQGAVQMEYVSGSGYPGEGFNAASQNGMLYLTNRRIIYVPSPLQIRFASLTIPLPNLIEGKLVQPWFAANRYEGKCIPVPNGGLTIAGQVRWIFKEGGAFEFSSIFAQLRSRLADEHEEEERLPTYVPPAADQPVVSASTSSQEATITTGSSEVPPQAQAPEHEHHWDGPPPFEAIHEQSPPAASQ
ncbi:hypothetical protein HDU76_006221 [Blyttiomyces sp. JEL0837]|nr:hypothetical protein HDU76_006221 [Blyttiomyces sp. JEL0837]